MAANRSFRTAALYASCFESQPILENHTLYESAQGRVFAGNPYAILLHLLSDPAYSRLHHVVAIRDLDHPTVARFSGLPNVTLVTKDSDEYVRFVQSCKYLVNDTSFPPYFIKRVEQVYIYTWHSTLLKRLAGHAGRPWEAKNIGKSLIACDYFVAPNRFTADTLLDAYYAESLFDGVITDFGYPRNDLVFSTQRDFVREQLRVKDGKKVVLYAPTWRGSITRPSDSIAQVLRYREEIQSRIGDGFEVVAKLHPMVHDFLNEENERHVAPISIDTNELLAATDILISDYSGIMFDYLITGNPIICFAFDRDAYLAQQGEFYFPLEDIPGPICLNVDDVAAAIADIDAVRERHSDQYAQLASRLIYSEDGRACERLARMVFLGDMPEPDKLYLRPTTAKKRILIHTGTLAGNGVTESFLALMNHLDYQKYDVTVLLPDANKFLERHREINEQANLVYLDVAFGYSESEYVEVGQCRTIGIDCTEDEAPLKRIFHRNIHRTLCGARFDYVIDYNGYSPFWSMALALGVDCDRRVIYLHNDMNRDRETKNHFLHATFSAYRFYDALFSVSKGSMIANRRHATKYIYDNFGFDIRQKLDYVGNLVEGDRIWRRAKQQRVDRIDGKDYLRTPHTGTPPMIREIEKPSRNYTNFITVGRLSPEKRQDRLLKAFARVSAKHPHTRLYVVGDGVLHAALISKARALGIGDSVVFTEYLDNPYPLMHLCDCFVLSSDYEGLGLVVLEALILGRAVISTDIAGPRDVLRPNYGVLTRRSVASIADAMLDFVENGMERDAFDYEAHNREALRLFYEKVCLEPAVAIEESSDGIQ